MKLTFTFTITSEGTSHYTKDNTTYSVREIEDALPTDKNLKARQNIDGTQNWMN